MAVLPQQSQSDPLTADTILDILSNRRRRYLLYALQDYDHPIELSKLADVIASWEHNRPSEDISQREYKSVYVSAVQCHVPKLADANVVNHDPERHTVILDENIAQLEPYLRLIARDEPEDTTLQSAIPYDESAGLLSQLRSNMSRLKR